MLRKRIEKAKEQDSIPEREILGLSNLGIKYKSSSTRANDENDKKRAGLSTYRDQGEEQDDRVRELEKVERKFTSVLEAKTKVLAVED